MTVSRSDIGRQGEKLAAQYLLQRGYTLLTANWRCTGGEIDIVARQNTTIVFVEVRTRRADSVDAALESITPRKQQQMLTAAQLYLAQNDLDAADWRIDVIAVALRRDSTPLIEHLENGLDW